ncbi:MAG: YhgE/Pip domain-containing protein [Andreesenia angusta]|nr:YhgE/Pip domain-containing protein [Andreesenia angusta]
MKKIIELYKLDWQRIFKNRIALFLILALTFIPSLYAWFNIAALWDPYSNTNELKVAVYSDDQKQIIKNKDVQIGKTIINELHNNKNMEWVFLNSKEDLTEGVKKGDYYAGIYIPRTFSKDILSFKDGNIKKPKIEYYSNEKINAIAPKITDKATDAVVEAISQNFIDTVTKTVFSEMNRMGIDVENNIPMIRKAKSLVFSLEDNEDLINEYIYEIEKLNDKLPEIENKLEQANAIVKLFPEINSASKKLVTINYRMDDFDRIGDLLTKLSENRDDFKAINKDMDIFSSKLDSLDTTLSNIIVQADDSIDFIAEIQKSLQSFQDNSSKIDSTITDMTKFNNDLKSAFSTINSSVNSSLGSIDILTNSIISNMEYTVEKLEDPYFTESDKNTVRRLLRSINENSKRNMKTLSNLKNVLLKIQELSGISNLFQSSISYIDNIYTTLDSLVNLNTKLLEDPIDIPIDSIKTNINIYKNGIEELKNNINSLKNSNLESSMENALNNINEVLSSSSDSLNSIRNMSPKLYGLLGSTKDSLSDSKDVLYGYKDSIPTIQRNISGLADLLSIGIESMNFGIDKAIYFYNKEFPELKSKINTVSDFAQFELPIIQSELEKEIVNINSAFPKMKSAVNSASEFIEQDYPKLKEANSKIADIIRKNENDIDVQEAFKVLKADAKKEGDFFAKPIEIKKMPMYHIPNYGSASSPFYTTLCLWVGGLLLSSMVTTKFYLDKDKEGVYSSKDTFFARLFTFLTIGIFQAIIVSIGNIVILGTYVANPIVFILSSIFLSLVFMSIIYTLVYLFDNLGKGIAIIILVLSISGGGGNFPIELSGKFFKIINPILPFTHAVNLLREAVGGVYAVNYIKYFFILLAFALLFLIPGVLFHKTISRKFEKISEEANKSHIFH